MWHINNFWSQCYQHVAFNMTFPYYKTKSICSLSPPPQNHLFRTQVLLIMAAIVCRVYNALIKYWRVHTSLMWVIIYYRSYHKLNKFYYTSEKVKLCHIIFLLQMGKLRYKISHRFCSNSLKVIESNQF
jgi:hypothetical protein